MSVCAVLFVRECVLLLYFSNMNVVSYFCVFLLLMALAEAHRGHVCSKSYRFRNHYKSLLVLKDCRVIDGNVEIALFMSYGSNLRAKTHMQHVILPKLEIITGHLFFYAVNGLISVGQLFPNLRAIKGITLYEDIYALVIYDMRDLEEIGTSKLTYIGRGYVKVGKTPKLCYVNTIEWNAIGPNSLAHVQLYRNDCLPCAPNCGGYCWNKDTCQVFNDDCHPECLGCTKPGSNAHCEVCKNLDDEGICVAECPENKYVLHILGKCISQKECHSRNHHTNPSARKPEIWFTYKGECRNTCPEDTQFNETFHNCEPCYNECYKSCEGAELVNSLTIEDMRGCTHINGSLSILSLRNNHDQDDLFTYLRSIRYIRDYLRISRCDVINDLQFLPNLREIGGLNLFANKSLLVHDNRNLKKLWDLSGNFSLQIRNGSIGFHDNDQLCLTEIERFASRAGIKYSETDVSKYSNGAYCDETIDKDLVVNITSRSSKNVTITWERRPGTEEFYYLIHYTDSLDADEKDQDVCSSPWTTVGTENNTVELVDLKIFRKYHFYIRTYMKNMVVRRTSIRSFETLPDDPDPPLHFVAFPIDDTSINLTWDQPERTNGILSSFKLTIYQEQDDPSFLDRDYCKFPFTPEGKMVDRENDIEEEETPITHEQNLAEVYRLKEPLYTYPGKPCEPTNEEVNIRLGNDVWLYLCDKNSKSLYGFDSCKNYYYEILKSNLTDPQMKKRETFSFDSGYISTMTLHPNATSHMVNELEPFTLYVFYIMACNEEDNGRKLCSSVIQSRARTNKSQSADTIPKLTIKKTSNYNLIVAWDPPRKPNGFVVAYHVYFNTILEKLESDYQHCITEQEYEQNKSIVLYGLGPATYYISVQVVSLAGVGNLSHPEKYILYYPDDWRITIYVLIAILIVMVLCAGAFWRYKVLQQRRSMNSVLANINPEYITLVYKADEWELDREDIELGQLIGQGAFGRVFFGRIRSRDLSCAVKTVNEEASESDRIKFLEEAATMKGFTQGAHVVKLLGIVSRDPPPLVIMELMERGDLKRYLLRMEDISHTLTSNEIYRMAIEIADGLAYLTSMKYVHRDLAARNCMVSNNKTVKIGDFGMTRDIYQSDYYKKGSGNALLPVRWMAPESIADGVNTYDTDIWSYGIVLWEIVTLAAQPYQGMSNEEVTQFVLSKGTLTRPEECPNLLWDIMRRCWEWQPKRRPTCFEVVEILQGHVGRDFESLSFFHSVKGLEFFADQGSVRQQNPPALGLHRFVDAEGRLTAAPENVGQFLDIDSGPSCSHTTHRLSMQFH